MPDESADADLIEDQPPSDVTPPTGPPTALWVGLGILVVVLVRSVFLAAETRERESEGVQLPPSALTEALRDVAAAQSAGLNGATTSVRRAYVYAGPPVYWEFDDQSRMVAVEVEFRGVGPGLDLDDVDFIDADTEENFGSDPLIQGLAPNGELMDLTDPDRPAGTFRVLLAHPMPRSARRVQLGYWGEHVGGPVAIEGEGPVFREPERRLLGWSRRSPTSVWARLRVDGWSRAFYPSSGLRAPNAGGGQRLVRYVVVSPEGATYGRGAMSELPYYLDGWEVWFELAVPETFLPTEVCGTVERGCVPVIPEGLGEVPSRVEHALLSEPLTSME